MKAFLVGATVALFPIALLVGAILLAIDHEAAKQAKCAHDLMWQLKPGITECYHAHDCTFNCKLVRKGKTQLRVLTAQ